MMEPFIVVDRAIKYPCANRAEVEAKMQELAEAGVKKVVLYRAEMVNLTELKK